MKKETKACQSCRQEFMIEPEDFDFYKKIDVPPPTRCPECRLIRRMVWRNEKTLYKRPDSRMQKPIFSVLSPETPMSVWERDYWFSDNWDPFEYGQEYDWNKPFLEQLKRLMRAVPWPSGSTLNLVRSDYSNNATNLKDCYLVFASADSENSAYATNLQGSKEIYDSAYVTSSELCYEGFFSVKCQRAFFSSLCESSYDIWFCSDCVGVNNCFGCVGLRNKSFHIFNQPYRKGEYFEKLRQFDIGSREKLDAIREQAMRERVRFPVRHLRGRHNASVSGDYLNHSKNVRNSYFIDNGENLKFCYGLGFGGSAVDSYDHFRWGRNSELIYESAISGDNISRLRFCFQCYPACNNLTYCIWCSSSSSLFGCVGLKKKQYCILNKQYTKEEYETMVPKIIEHMNGMPYRDAQGREYRFGEFFPPEFSPYAYNETSAQEYFPLTREQTLSRGYRWQDARDREYRVTKTADSLPDHIKDADDSILREVIGCMHESNCNEQCAAAFKIIPQELAFLRKYNLPLPRLCPNCRHYQRLAQRTPVKLFHRRCACAGSTSSPQAGAKSANGAYANAASHSHGAAQCPNEFETTYAPNRSEIVYCESCYNAEVV